MSEQAKATVQARPKMSTNALSEGSILQRAAVNATPGSDVPAIVHDVLTTPGQPLDPDTKEFMESRFRHDFSNVQIRNHLPQVHQTSLKIGPVGDKHEQEAERQADSVIHTPATSYLDRSSRFDHDFSQIRIHTDTQAAKSARLVNAHAYTVGRDIVFGEGEYNPGTHEGRKLLAHELTHTIQQSQTGPRMQRAAKNQEPMATVKMYEYTFEGKKFRLTEEQYQREITRVKHNLEVYLRGVEEKAAYMAQEHQKFLNETHAHWYSVGVVSDIVANTAPPSVGIWSWPKSAIANGRVALQAGKVEIAGRQLELAEKAFKDAEHEWNSYLQKTIGGAEVTKGYLENVRDISFSIAIGTAAVVAAPVVAGAIAATGAGTAVTAVGTGVVVTAGGAGTGAILRGGTSAAGQALAGDKVNWAEVKKEAKTGAKRGTVDAATSVVGIGAGKALGTARTLGGRVVKGALAGSVSSVSGTALEGALEGKSLEEIAKSSGKSAVVGLVGGGVGGGGGHLLGETSQGAKFVTGVVSGGAASATGTYLAGGSRKDIQQAFLTGGLTAGASSVAEHHPAIPKEQVAPEPQKAPLVSQEESTLLPQPTQETQGTAFQESVSAAKEPQEVVPATKEAVGTVAGEATSKVEEPQEVIQTIKEPTAQTLVTAEPASSQVSVAKPALKPATPQASAANVESASSTSTAKTAEIEKPATSAPKTDEEISKATPATDKAKPTGESGETDTDISDEVERSFEKTFEQTPIQGPSPKPPAPEPMARSKVKAANEVLGKGLDNVPVLKELWNKVAKPTNLTKENSRAEFNKHRSRFWRAVRKDSAARKIFKDAGFKFPKRPTSAPVYEDVSGRQGRISLDHMERRADNPARAVDSSNLRIVIQGDNTLLENIQQANPTVKEW